MRRTQLYLDDDLAKILSTVSRQRGSTVSELMRECIREKFGKKQNVDKAALARQIAGVWKNRRDLGDTEKYVRRLRKDAHPSYIWERIFFAPRKVSKLQGRSAAGLDSTTSL